MKLKTVRIGLRPQVYCDTCEWRAAAVDGKEARSHANKHLSNQPRHKVISDQITRTIYQASRKSEVDDYGD